MDKTSEDVRLNSLTEKLRLRLDGDQLTNCMRCGFCLPACPTFAETGIEAESPRGRIALMKAVKDGIMAPDVAFEEQMNHCLGCRACEPACPADVKYGQLIEQARDAIEDHTKTHRGWVKLVRHTAFQTIFPNQKRVRWMGKGLRFYQTSGMRTLARKTGAMKMFPKHMREMEEILPDVAVQGVVEQIGILHPAKGEKIATVALFRGCLMDVLFADTNIHTVDLLTEAGFEVVIPEQQNCCGAMHAHSGEIEGARSLARSNISIFKAAGVDYIVSNAGGCGALLLEYDHLLHEDEQWKDDAMWFAERVIDVSDLLVRMGRLLVFSEREENQCVRITYQDSCHLRNVMRSSDAPRRLMRQVTGVEFVEMKEAERCCGSAGTYTLTQPVMSGQILDHKMEHVRATDAQYLLTSNPGCLLQMMHGINQHGLNGQMKAVHIVDFLHERMCGQDE
ncbi:(Fe-S)-binding protein [Paenibacillus segetis]|uniref:Glycolate oxidase iron-sulfur subunit n=1 Tax=Paenibacillus segetis TaxID=1325360 RepID=A0ABQ1YLM4_9BACL|nr:(Fe-S)-binding protein [Paenibacillus segetis]GGH29406.1 glycolate oxidase iron-sulfur subunit [Paenibacillus segetis]